MAVVNVTVWPSSLFSTTTSQRMFTRLSLSPEVEMLLAGNGRSRSVHKHERLHEFALSAALASPAANLRRISVIGRFAYIKKLVCRDRHGPGTISAAYSRDASHLDRRLRRVTRLLECFSHFSPK